MGTHEEFRKLLEAVGNTVLEPVVDSVEPLDRAVEAMGRMEAGKQFGKIVLAVAD